MDPNRKFSLYLLAPIAFSDLHHSFALQWAPLGSCSLSPIYISLTFSDLCLLLAMAATDHRSLLSPLNLISILF